MTTMKSRERLIRSLDRQVADHIPCCFMSFTALRKRCNEDLFSLCQAELDLGLDSMLFVPTASRPARREHPDLRGLPVRFHSEVRSTQWVEPTPGGGGVLHRNYATPAGMLTARVRLAEDWPHGHHLPFVDDFQVSHSLKPLITEPEDLEPLRFLLAAPQGEDTKAFEEEMTRARAFVSAKEVLLAGGWGVGLDMAGWLLGVGNLVTLVMDKPALVRDLLQIIHEWNMQRMAVVLSAPVDLFIRRAWYEGCDFIIPRMFRSIVLPFLKTEVELAHERGSRFGYICTSGTIPMLELYAEAGLDVLIGLDPVQGSRTDLPRMRQELAGKVAMWGGVSGAITVEQGNEVEIREAVERAIETLGPDGFILSPVDNITLDQPKTWRNLQVFIDAWQGTWRPGIGLPNFGGELGE